MTSAPEGGVAFAAASTTSPVRRVSWAGAIHQAFRKRETAERLSFQPFDLDRRKTRGLIDRRTWPLPKSPDRKRIHLSLR
jgi:hypothetical protein